jgi:predicted MFS family arabinose efflux permease
MYRLNLLQNQWLILALFVGLALIGGLVLAYLAMWRPREEEAPKDAAQSAPARPSSPVPWVLIVTYLFAVLYVVVYTFILRRNPPNW